MRVNYDTTAQDARILERAYEERDKRMAAEREAYEDFMTDCQRGDAGSLATWAGLTDDFSQPLVPGQPRAMRYEQLWEVAESCLDLGDGPTKQELFQLALNVASGKQTQEQLQAMAKNLLEGMATKYVTHIAKI